MLAARGSLARLVVVIGVLAGVVFAHGVQCTDGMTTMAVKQVASSSMALGAGQDAAPAVIAFVGDSSPGSHGPGGVLAACLMFIVAVVAVSVGLRSALFRIFVAVLTFGGGRRVFRVVAPRAPKLAELCLLRT